jgi:hypothetical protein
MAGKSSWMLPVAAGIGIGWFFSGTIGHLLGALHLPISGGHAGYAYPAQVAPSSHPHQQYPSPHVQRERRSFDRAYDSWLSNTVNALPTIG